MSPDDIKLILEAHRLWCAGDPQGRRADLSYANLSYADLHKADLSYADMRGANLSYANLSDADLRGANLSDADLRGANLHEANLRHADLWGTVGNGREIVTLVTVPWIVVWTADVMQIGYERCLIDDWAAFPDEEIEQMAPGALPWWRIWKPVIFAAIAAHKEAA